MQNSLRLPDPQLRGRAMSWSPLNIKDLEISSILQRHRSISVFDFTQDTQVFTTSSSDAYEILYKITDIVLIICAVIFVISAVVSITLWVVGIIFFNS